MTLKKFLLLKILLSTRYNARRRKKRRESVYVCVANVSPTSFSLSISINMKKILFFFHIDVDERTNAGKKDWSVFKQQFSIYNFLIDFFLIIKYLSIFNFFFCFNYINILYKNKMYDCMFSLSLLLKLDGK